MENVATKRAIGLCFSNWRNVYCQRFTYIVFKEHGYELIWEGEGENEVGIDINSRETLVEVSPKYFRPTEVVL